MRRFLKKVTAVFVVSALAASPVMAGVRQETEQNHRDNVGGYHE